MAGKSGRRCGRALITRPKEDAEKSRARLREFGFEVVMEPLLEIIPCMGSKPQIIAAILRKPQAVLVTSANGIRMLAKYADEKDLNIFAVGDSSADIARQLGYKKVQSASGDAKELFTLVKKKLTPGKGFILHIAGNVVKHGLKEKLEEEGFEVQRISAYEARPVKGLSAGLKVALANCEIDFVVFYSSRTAEVFEELMRNERIDYLAPNIEIFSLSPNIKTTLEWKRIYIAEKPHEDCLLQLIDEQTSDKIQ